MYKYLNPRNDVAFKRIFGTEKNKVILISFLNEVLRKQLALPIEDIEFLKPSQDPTIASRKQSIVDVLCKDKEGVQYIVEMQVAKTGGFEKRAQFYAAKAYIDQMKAGDERYINLKEVIFIAIADYDIFPNKKHYKSEHVILDRFTLENDLSMFSFTFVNLPKFDKEYNDSKRSLTDLSLEEKWYYFLKHAEEMRGQELETLTGGDIMIREAYKELEMYNWSDTDLAIYEGELKRQRDEYNIELYKQEEAQRRQKEAEKRALEKGIQQGMEKGMEKGLEQGIEKARLEMARKMRSKGVDINAISEFTGFSKSELEIL